jgi:hypothetical protein
VWGAVAAAVVGAGAAAYGANKQSKAQKAANAQNSAAVGGSDDSAWASYLLTRGLAVPEGTPAGVIPAGATPVNSRLPLWANMSMPSKNSTTAQPRGGFLRKRGA